MYSTLAALILEYRCEKAGYDDLYEFLEGWIAYAKHANTYHVRKKITLEFERTFRGQMLTKEVNRCPKHLKFPQLSLRLYLIQYPASPEDFIEVDAKALECEFGCICEHQFF